MHSTGLEALDSRLGGVERGRFFLVFGEDGVGKSVLGAHFLAAGLDRRERCVLVTSDRPDAIDARGMFVGFSPGALSRHPSLTVVDLKLAVGALGSSHRHPPVEALRRAVQAADEPVSRVVIDDANAFLRQSHSPDATARALVDLLAELNVSAYLIVSTADPVALEDSVLDVLADAAAAAIVLESAGRGRKRLVFRHVRQTSFSTEPFLYTMRTGGGFAEDLPAYDRNVDASLRKRIVILDEIGVVPDEVVTALRGKFEVEIFTDLNGSLSQLLEARYGVLILGMDPYDPERTFNLTYSLRKAGNGAPILFISRSKGLRSMTRARALRIGGDDFMIAELPQHEIVERISVTAHRGHHRRNGSVRPDRLLQPRAEDGTHRPMSATELTQAVGELIREAPTPFFALAVLELEGGVPGDEVWEAIGPQIRLSDGDLLSILPDGRVALVLNQVDLALAQRVLGRLRRAHPALATAPGATVLTSPLQSDELRSWVAEVELRRVPG
jgi:KaiC/GvpD/RAD55 family RecA-like ATPase/DNA-binding NarL/FixJ family response regulator